MSVGSTIRVPHPHAVKASANAVARENIKFTAALTNACAFWSPVGNFCRSGCLAAAESGVDSPGSVRQ